MALACPAPAHGRRRSSRSSRASRSSAISSRKVGGERVAVTTLVGPDGDAHVYRPRPPMPAASRRRKLVFVNGLGFEGWMPGSCKASGAKARSRRRRRRHQAAADDRARTAHAQRPIRMPGRTSPTPRLYVANIRDALERGRSGRRGGLRGEGRRLSEPARRARRRGPGHHRSIPAERRKIITSHDAFGYFGGPTAWSSSRPRASRRKRRPRPGTWRASSGRSRRRRSGGVPREHLRSAPDRAHRRGDGREDRRAALFGCACREPDGPAGTYIDMMRHNIRAFSAALSS